MEFDTSLFITDPHNRRVEKPWGYEIIMSPDGLGYCSKLLMVKAGCKLSFQYHDQKMETLSLFTGSALVWMENTAGEIEKIPMQPLHGYTMAVGQKHRVEALEDSFIFESSLPETGTTIRVEDDYSRPHETEELRNSDPDRGWKA